MVRVHAPHDIGMPLTLKESECHVCGRQILTSKVDPRTVRIKIF